VSPLISAFVEATPALMWPAFTLWGGVVTWTEVLACALSVWMVVCNLRVQALGWPLAMLSSLLYAGLFVHYKLYGEASLQVFFVLIAGWGWWQWVRGPQARPASGGESRRKGAETNADAGVRWLSAELRAKALLATLLAWPLLGLALSAATDSDVPYLDALPTVGSIAGQILLGRKFIDNWPVWIAVNLVSMGLFAYKALWLTVLLYGVFALLAVAGWRAWAGRLALAMDARHA
jgi:nicotinamide mononucleotide transporter